MLPCQRGASARRPIWCHVCCCDSTATVSFADCLELFGCLCAQGSAAGLWQPQSGRHTPFTAMRSFAQAAEGLQRRPTLKRASSDGLGSVQGERDACGCSCSQP